MAVAAGRWTLQGRQRWALPACNRSQCLLTSVPKKYNQRPSFPYAVLCLYYVALRAIEAQKDDRLIEDPLAASLAGPVAMARALEYSKVLWKPL